MTFSALDSILTGPLFATEAMRATFSDRARVAAMLRVEAALARAQAQLGIVPGELAAAIEAIAPDDLDPAAIGKATAQAGVPVIPFVKAVQGRLDRELEPHFHKAATTQDILDTATVLQARDGLDFLKDDLVPTLQALSRLAWEHRTTPCVGRTYGQHAAPITFGFKVAVWLAGLADVASRFADMRARIAVASLGGPVGTLAGVGENGPALLDLFAQELALEATALSWHTQRQRMAELGAYLATLIGALAKIATDIVFLGSTDIGEVSEPAIKGRGGSSAMPHKRNPVGATVILAAHGAAKGAMVTLFDSMAAANERPAGAWHAEWHALPQLFGLASGALREARLIAEGIVVYPERMQANLDMTRGLLFADAAASALSRHVGRARAHELVEEAADRVRESGQSLAAVLAEMADVPAAALAGVFELDGATAAAAGFVDRAVADGESVIDALQGKR
jgi:3-carboxy-cis,cis-muconate cycloisomerase